MRRLATLAPRPRRRLRYRLSPQYLVEDLRILAVRVQVVEPRRGRRPRGDRPAHGARREPRGRAPLRVRWATCIPDGTEALPPASTRTRCAISTRSSLIRASSPSVRGRDRGDRAGGRRRLRPDHRASGGEPRLRLQPVPSCRCSSSRRQGASRVAVKRVRLTPRSETAGTELAGAYVTNSNPVPLAIRLVEEEGLPCGDGVPVVVPCFDDSACGGTGCGPDGYCAAAFPRDAASCARARTRRGRPAVQPVRARRDVHPVLRVARLAVLRDRRQIPRVQRRRERDG